MIFFLWSIAMENADAPVKKGVEVGLRYRVIGCHIIALHINRENLTFFNGSSFSTSINEQKNFEKLLKFSYLNFPKMILTKTHSEFSEDDIYKNTLYETD